MASKVDKRTGKVFVEKGAVLDDIIDSLEFPTGFGNNHSRLTDSQSMSSRSKASNLNHIRLLQEQQKQRTTQTEQIMKLNIQKSIERENEKQERIFPVLLSNLDKATNFLDTIEKEINLHDETQKNKVRRQFEDWNTTVHGSIQKKISHTINSMDAKALNKKKNEDYEKFLSITNRKPAIFRDIIIESEYDPLEPNRHCIKAKTGFLKDPVKIDAQKAASEGAMLGDKSVRSARLCKETLSVELWATGKIEATPYGTFERMMNKKGGSGSGEAVVSKRNSTQRSSVIMDHFDYPRSKESIDREMPRGKRIQPILIYADPGKVFHQGVPKDFGEDLARIKPAENYSYLA